ncbi:MAG: YeeE/YedE thiosulfate transporter family protein [Gemmatimonadaceae bacterium]
MYLMLGICFGVVLVKSEVISWYRIQELFRFQAFHMYGVIGSAVVVAAVALQLIKRLHLRALDGQPITVPSKAMGRGTRYWLGGTLFGLGWGLIGACPGPLLALLGSGVGVMAVAVISALVGTWAYGVLRPRLPH